MTKTWNTEDSCVILGHVECYPGGRRLQSNSTLGLGQHQGSFLQKVDDNPPCATKDCEDYPVDHTGDDPVDDTFLAVVPDVLQKEGVNPPVDHDSDYPDGHGTGHGTGHGAGYGVQAGRAGKSPLCKSNGVRTYPSLYYWIDGVKKGPNYGPRSYGGLNNFIKKTFPKDCQYKKDKEAQAARQKLIRRIILAIVLVLLLLALLAALYYLLKRGWVCPKCPCVCFVCLKRLCACPKWPLGSFLRRPLLVSPETSDGFVCQDAPSGPAWVLACHSCISDPTKMANTMEETFSSLKTNVRSVHRSGTLGDIEGKSSVLYFLVQFAAQRPPYKAQAKEVMGWLETSPAWAQVISKDPKLRSLKASAFK